MSSLVSKITKKITKMKNLSEIKFPEFLNTAKKYSECIQNTKTVKQFEEICLKLLADDSITMIDIMKIMGKMEADIISVHGNKEVSCILDMAEAIISYHMISSKEKAQQILARDRKQQNKQQREEEEFVTCDCELGAELAMTNSKPAESKSGRFVCDCDTSYKTR